MKPADRHPAAAPGAAIPFLAAPLRPARPWRASPLQLLGLCALVLAASALLVPRGVELASLLARSGHIDHALPLLEQAFSEGDRSVTTIAALARARAHAGNMEGSIELLRGLVQMRPKDVAALQLLADTYRKAQRRSEYRDTLEQLQARVPTAGRQRELVRLYLDEGLPQQQMAGLTSLIERFDAGEVADHLRLAALQLQHGAPGPALATLDRMVKSHPRSLDASVVAVQMSALLASGGDVAAAMQRARAWLHAHPEAVDTEAPLLASTLGAAGRPDLQAELLEPFRTGAHPDARLLAAWAQAMSDSGHPQQALAGIQDFDSAPDDGAGLLRLKVGLALATGQLDIAAEATRALGVERLPPILLTGFAAAALAAGRADLLRIAPRGLASAVDARDAVRAARIALALGEPPALASAVGARDAEPARRAAIASGDWSNFVSAVGAQDAVLAARVALALGDPSAALHWSEAAIAALPSDTGRMLQLARLLQRIGEPKKALDVLQAVSLHDAGGAETDEYARLSIALGNVTTALTLIAELRRQQPGDALDEVWMLLATADRRYGEVLSWLNGAANRGGSTDLLRDVLHLAMDGKAYALAVATGQKLLRNTEEDRDRLLLANALMAAGRAPEAVVQFRALRRRGLSSDDVYAAALLAAWRQGVPVADELRGIFLARLAQAKRESQRDAAITTLLALGAHAQLLATLEPLVTSDPQRWLGVFTEAATKAGQPGRLTEMWKRLAEAESTPAALRTQFAFRLLETNEKRVAERVFRALAAGAPPGDAATQRLLFVWGPKPTNEQLGWLESRAAGAGGEERAAWLRLLTERGAALRAIAVYRRSAPGPGEDAVRDAYLDAVVAAGDKAALAAAIRELAPQARTASQIGRLARRAAGSGDPALERQLLEAAVAAGDEDPKLRRTLGLLAYRLHDFAAAGRSLEAFHQRAGGDVETHRAVGEIHLRQRDVGAARRSFQQALAALEGGSDNSFRSRVVKAALLSQLDRKDEARRLYESLLAERPGDSHLRADYAAMLIDAGDDSKARQVLAAK